MLDPRMIALMKGAKRLVDCKTIEQRREVLLVLQENGFNLTSCAQAHLSMYDDDFTYLSVGMLGGHVDCWLPVSPDKAISFEEFMDANCGGKFDVANTCELEMLYEKE